MRAQAPPVVSVATRDPDEFAESLLRVSPLLEVTAESRSFRAAAKLMPLARMGMVQPTIVDARVQKPLVEGVYGLHVPLRSPLEFRMRSRYEIVKPGYAHLTGPGSALDLRAAERGDALAIVVPADLLQDYWLGPDAEGVDPLHGEPTVFTLASPAGRRLFRAMSTVWGEVLRAPTTMEAKRDFENGILEVLAQALQPPIDGSGTIRNARRILDRARSYIRAHLGLHLTVLDIARAAGTSNRTLYRLFLQEEQVTPIEFIKRERMDFIRRALLASSEEETTVARLAVQHGFNHFGRFAGQYSHTFGELPSETLRH